VSKPVVLRFHADDTQELVSALLAQQNQPLTFISWEHKNLVTAARTLITQTGGDASQVPSWPLRTLIRFLWFSLTRSSILNPLAVMPKG
jgi:hypothetical protein